MNERQEELNKLLQRVTEECSEVIQAISKLNLFGEDNEYKGSTNKENLQQEVGDLLALIIVIIDRHPELLNNKVLETAIRKKVVKLKKYVPSLKDFDLDKAFTK